MAQLLEWLGKVNFLRHTQRAALQDERERLEEQARQPVLGAKSGIQNPGAIKQEIKKIDRQLMEQVPRDDLTPQDRDLLAKTKRELEAEILAGMPTHEEMRRNPPGTVHRHMQWEKTNKPKLNLLKNILIQLDPKSDDPDLANLERLRPKLETSGASTHMVNAQIPGHHAMTPLAKENWPPELPPQGTVNSPLAQAQKRERTPEERKAWGQAMQTARRAKKTVAAKEA